MRRFLSALVYTGLAIGAIAGPAVAGTDLAALATGEMRKLSFAAAPKPMDGTIAWTTPEGETRLADFAGRWVVLNYWAVWCAPCREEMPTLAALQEARGGADLAVVALASGPQAAEAVPRFLQENGAADLIPYREPTARQARDSAVFGLPVTLIIDPEGREVARLIGGADWNAPETHAVLDALMAR